MNHLLKEHSELKTLKPEMTKIGNMLSTEDFGVFIKNISGFFTNKINIISSIFTSNGNRTPRSLDKEYNVFVKDLMDYKNVVPKIVSNVKYMNVEKVIVPSVVGLRNNLPNSTPILVEAIKSINDNLEKLIDVTDTEISKILTDKEYRTSTRIVRIDSDFYGFSSTLNKCIEGLMDPKLLVDTKPLNAVLPNMSSLNQVYTDIVNISTNNTFKHLKELEKQINNLADRTNILYDYIKNDKEGKLEVSKVVINRLSELLELSADCITDSVTILHMYNQVTGMTTSTIEILKKYI